MTGAGLAVKEAVNRAVLGLRVLVHKCQSLTTGVTITPVATIPAVAGAVVPCNKC